MPKIIKNSESQESSYWVQSQMALPLSPDHFPCFLFFRDNFGALFARQISMTLIQTDTDTELQRKTHWVRAGKEGQQQRHNESHEVQEVCGTGAWERMSTLWVNARQVGVARHTGKTEAEGSMWKWMKRNKLKHRC